MSKYKALCNFTCVVNGGSKQLKKDEIVDGGTITQEWLSTSISNGFLKEVLEKETTQVKKEGSETIFSKKK